VARPAGLQPQHALTTKLPLVPAELPSCASVPTLYNTVAHPVAMVAMSASIEHHTVQVRCQWQALHNTVAFLTDVALVLFSGLSAISSSGALVQLSSMLWRCGIGPNSLKL